ncbi:glycoside hydrolase family 73 protein [Pseudoduganella namucuonensis]|uniref:Flagellar protein FlgJ n=1 Tax=Pseudoduganella namucuonensis TaxID=1035707 RepID=A0A1I7HUJ4_9BURK|nr:glucosaminidase domain-containing protein [Pseudoduganella namucuonensis]SFU64249.1 flagellar protein FlgJ [Pseudoduganella namucuonensis]
MNPFNLQRATAATPSTAATASNMRPAAATQGMGGGFGSAFSQVQRDVSAFIAQGGGMSAGGGASPPTLSSQTASSIALALQARAAGGTDGSGAIADAATASPTESQQQFLDSIKPWAAAAAKRLGVAPELVAAHAALESGWGKHPVGNNLFGIKAGAQWQGETASSATTEYTQGVAMKKVERFRSYPDQASGFDDYADLLIDNPRYQQALNTGSDAKAFAQGLVRGGYATDPAYAAKLAATAARLQAMRVQPGD